MRPIIKGEAAALLQGAKSGILDLRTMPGYKDGKPMMFYGECTKHADGSHTWEAKHLPIPSDHTWRALCNLYHRDPIILLPHAERAEIIKASIQGEIDESRLPSIYPLNRRPNLGVVYYRGFTQEEQKTNLYPDPPQEWGKMFEGFLGDLGFLGEEAAALPLSVQIVDDFMLEHFPPTWRDDLHLEDLSTGEPLTQEEALLYDHLVGHYGILYGD